MEQHPIPQNVTNFQFRLIGDMTIKQFGYLAGGAILAFITYKLPLPFFFTWPLAILFALGGFGFAFLPIEERPMDVWVMSFIKSIYNPTQFIWQRSAPKAQPPTLVRSSPPNVVPPKPVVTSSKTGNPPDQKPSARTVLTQIIGERPNQPIPAAHVPSPFHPAPNRENENRTAEMEKRLASLERELVAKKELEIKLENLQKQLTELAFQKNQLEEKFLASRKQNIQQVVDNYHPSVTNITSSAPDQSPVAEAKPLESTSTIKIISPGQAVGAGLPKLTIFPNIVTGIVKDNSANLLPGVLVTVKDKSGVPLRALKTNKLGQFAASTPLPNGVYFLEIEDPRNRFVFDRAQITLNGNVMPPLEIVAKSQKEITRNKLAEEIFGKQNI